MIRDNVFNCKRSEEVYVKNKARDICHILEQQLSLFEKFLYNGAFKLLLLKYFDNTMNALGYILMTYTCINPKIDHSTPKEYAKPKKGVTGFDHLHPEQIQIIEIFYDIFVCFYSEFGIKSRLVYYIKYK